MPPNDANTESEHREANELTLRLVRARTIALTAVVLIPLSLNAQNIVEWAHNQNGLHLAWPLAWLAFGGLDLIAGVCVLETLIQTQRGRRAVAFAALVWVFAAASAFAGWQHGHQPEVGRDVKWFFPLMAIAGPLLLHLILRRYRLDVQEATERRLTHATASSFGWTRWLPGIGAFGETWCAWRVGRLEGITKPGRAIDRYRTLRPHAGRFGMRVLQAIRTEAERTPPAVTPVRTATNTQPRPVRAEQPALVGVVRPIESARRANTTPNPNSAPSGDVAANIAALKQAFPDWRTNTPSVRKIAEAIGVTSTSTGQTYQRRLIAERETEQNDTTEEATA